MKDFFKSFFAVDNTVNEDTVMGFIFSIVLVVGFFVKIDNEALYILAGLVTLFFGLGSFKRP